MVSPQHWAGTSRDASRDIVDQAMQPKARKSEMVMRWLVFFIGVVVSKVDAIAITTRTRGRGSLATPGWERAFSLGQFVLISLAGSFRACGATPYR